VDLFERFTGGGSKMRGITFGLLFGTVKANHANVPYCIMKPIKTLFSRCLTFQHYLL